MSFIEKKWNKLVLWGFLSLSYNHDCKTALWKNRDCEKQVTNRTARPVKIQRKILRDPKGFGQPYATPTLKGFSCHAIASHKYFFPFVLVFLAFALLTVSYSMLHFSEGRPSRSDLSILVAHNDDPTGNQDINNQ